MNPIRLTCLGSFSLLCFLLLSSSAIPQLPFVDTDERITEQLSKYYKAVNGAEFWKSAVDKVAKGAPDSTAAGDYLRALLIQTAADEDSGKAPWRATPYWGSNGENPARNLRKAITKALAEQDALSEAAVPVIAWVLEHEKVLAIQHSAADALKITSGDSADRLVAKLISPKTTNNTVLSIAIETAGERRALRGQAQNIATLAAHHHRKVREAARKVADNMGVKNVPMFDPSSAMRDEPIASLMRQMSALVDLPPTDASVVRVTVSHPRPKGEPLVVDVIGWQLERDDTSIEVFTPHLSKTRFQLKPDPNPASRAPKKVTVNEIEITDWVELVESIRSGGDKDSQFSSRGGLTGQFEGGGASVYEAILGLWLYEAKHDELAARIVLPALDTLHADKYFGEKVYQRIGKDLGLKMLISFIGERDFETATRHAKQIVQDCPNSQFYERAIKLAEELPKRSGDFKTFTLPTPDEWTKLKKELSRGEQIDYLCKRLRLLNVYQVGQPGGITYSQSQWSNPQGLTADAAWPDRRNRDKGRELINPYTELTGKTNTFHRGEDPTSASMKLTVNDIPRVAKHLQEEDWHILAVSFWRDFHPHRGLHKTEPILRRIVSDLAGGGLRYSVSKLKNEETADAEMSRIQAWVSKRTEQTHADLVLDTIKGYLANDVDYLNVSLKIAKMVEYEDQRVVPIMVECLARDDLRQQDRVHLLRDLRKLNAQAGLEHARKLHGKGEIEERSIAALIELDAGDTERAVQLLSDVLNTLLKNTDYHSNRIGDTLVIMRSLMATDRDDAREVVLQQFSDDRLFRHGSDFFLPKIIRIAAEAGEPSGLKRYREILDNDTNSFAGRSYSREVRFVFANYFLRNYDRDDPTLSKISKTTEPYTAARIDALKQWMDDKIRTFNDKNDQKKQEDSPGTSDVPAPSLPPGNAPG